MKTVTKTYDIYPLDELSATARDTAYSEWLNILSASPKMSTSLFLSASPKIGLIKSGQKSVNLQSDEKREI